MSQRRVGGTPEGLYADFRKGQRVMSVEGFAGTVDDVLEGGPGGNTIIVTLDNGMGGGQYRESDLSPLNTSSASVIGTAAEWYPELGTILSERPDLAASVSARDYLMGTVSQRLAAAKSAEPPPFAREPLTASLVHCTQCDVDYAIDSPDEKHDHSKTALEYNLHLPLDMSTQGPPLHSQMPGYDDGFAQAQSGATREPASDDSTYRSNFARGWGDGIGVRPPSTELPTTDADDLGSNEDIQTKYAGVMNFIKGDDTPSKNWAGPGHNWSFDWCFPPEAPVLMADGTEKPISEVVVGDRVITHKGNIKTVTWAGSRAYEGDLVYVSVHGDTTREVVATDRHRFFSANRDFGLLDNSKAMSYRGVKRADLDARSGWEQVGDLRSMDYLSRSVLSEQTPLLLTYAKPAREKIASGEMQDVKIEGEIAWLLGLYMGDGYLQSHGYGVSFSLHEDQTDLIDRISDVAQNYFGVRAKVYPEKNKRAVRVDVAHWALFALVEDMVGHGSAAKRLDGRLLTLPLTEQEHLLSGYLDSDGCRSDDGRSCASSISQMPRQVREIATRLGHTVNMRPDSNDGYPNGKPSVRVEWWSGKNRLTKQFLRDGEIWQQIKSVRREHYEGLVFDIEVEDDHSFRAYGFNVHNCRFRKNSHCFLPKELNEAASDEAGYAVWVPEDRGVCPRILWEEQKQCPVGEPGPHVPNGYGDATVSWEDGGQHGGTPGPGYRDEVK